MRSQVAQRKHNVLIFLAPFVGAHRFTQRTKGKELRDKRQGIISHGPVASSLSLRASRRRTRRRASGAFATTARTKLLCLRLLLQASLLPAAAAAAGLSVRNAKLISLCELRGTALAHFAHRSRIFARRGGILLLLLLLLLVPGRHLPPPPWEHAGTTGSKLAGLFAHLITGSLETRPLGA